MAASKEAHNVKIAELTQCSICMERLKTPKCLPCIHTFCLACLEKYGQEEHPGDEMACPLCRKPFAIPLKGFEELPNNFFIEELIDAMAENSLKQQQVALNCEGCNKKNATACTFCVHCEQHFCKACSENHGKVRATASHKLVSLEEKVSDQVQLKAAPKFCDAHRDKQLELYCHDCKIVICLKCSILKHRNHFCEDLEETSRKFSDDLKRSLPQLHPCIEANESELELLNATKLDLLEQIANGEEAIDAKCNDLKLQIDAQRSDLRRQLYEFKGRRLKEMQTRKDDVERQLMILKSFKQYVDEITEKGSSCQIASSVTDLLRRTEELVTSQTVLSGNRLSLIAVTLTSAGAPRTWADSEETGLLGELDFNECEVADVAIVLGLTNTEAMTQSVCHINIERPDSVRTIDSTPAWVGNGTAACVMRDILYAVGIGKAYDKLWKWSEASDWMRCADMMSGRGYHCVAVVDSTLYALGGIASDKVTTLSSVDAYDVRINKWSAAGQLTHAVEMSACVAYRNSIYIFGGTTKNQMFVHHVQMYDPALQTCTLMSHAMPRPHRAMRAVLWGTSAILLDSSYCYIYNFDNQTWQEREWYRTDVEDFGLLLHQDRLFIFGGELRIIEKAVPQAADNIVKVNITRRSSSDAVKSVSVLDIIEDRQETGWVHHATLPEPGLVFAFSSIPLSVHWLK